MPDILVCGDVHGHAYQLLDLIEQVEEGKGIGLDAVLQVGDMGVWSSPDAVDSASRRFAERDPRELDLLEFILGGEKGKRYASKRDWPRVYFVRGNHEDFDYLESIGYGPVDEHDMLWHIPGGKVVDIEGYRVGALGGAYYQGNKARKALRPCYTRPGELEELSKAEKLDIVLSHDAPLDMPRQGAGSPWLLELIRKKRPGYVFCGHFHHPGSCKRYVHDEGMETLACLLDQIVSPFGKTEGYAGVLTDRGFEFLSDL